MHLAVLLTVLTRFLPELDSRSAAFGPRISQAPGLLGYVLPLSSFTYPCQKNSSSPRPAPAPIPATLQDETDENWGCPSLCLFDEERKPAETWIALVQRGNCSFVDKVREAMHFGARGVIIGGSAHNPEGGDSLVTMYNTGKFLCSPTASIVHNLINVLHLAGASEDITIPSAYITHASYKSLMSVITASNTTISGLKTVSLLMGFEETWQWYAIGH